MHCAMVTFFAGPNNWSGTHEDSSCLRGADLLQGRAALHQMWFFTDILCCAELTYLPRRAAHMQLSRYTKSVC